MNKRPLLLWFLCCCAASLFSRPGSALPRVRDALLPRFSSTGQASAVVFLPDSVDASVVHLVPTGLGVVKLDDGGPLFRMTVRRDGSADVFAVMRLSAPASTEDELTRLRMSKPGLKVSWLPLVAGRLRLSVIKDGTFEFLLGESAEPVNAYPNADVPLAVHVSAEGVGRLRGLLQTRASILLALVFEYSFKASVDGTGHMFTLDSGAFLHQVTTDGAFLSAVEELQGLSSQWGEGQLLRAFLRSLMPVTSTDPGDPSLLRGLLTLNGLLGKALGTPEDRWWSARSLRYLETTPASAFPRTITLEAPGASTVTLVQAQAGALLKGVCQRYADLVYNEKGEVSCDVLIPPAGLPEPTGTGGSPDGGAPPVEPPTGTRPFDPFFD